MNVVVIPARDEGRRIGRALAALGAQREAPAFTVLMLANNCRDDTAEQARQWHGRLRLEVQEVTLPPAQANVVGARRLALDLGSALAGPHGTVVSTDADTEAAPDWLAALLRPLRQPDADAVAGRILLRADERRALSEPVRSTHLLDTGYRQAAAQLRARLVDGSGPAEPTHWQHFGANLALRVSAYRGVGGLPDVTQLEDMALVAALRRQDRRVVHTHAAKVYTSARLTGRVPVGLSTQLSEWSAGPARWTVPGGAELLAAAHAERCLRAAWTSPAGGTAAAGASSADAASLLACAWHVSQEAAQQALRAPTSGLAAEQLDRARNEAGVWRRTFAPVPVRQALWEVRAALADLGGLPLRTVGQAERI